MSDEAAAQSWLDAVADAGLWLPQATLLDEDGALTLRIDLVGPADAVDAQLAAMRRLPDAVAVGRYAPSGTREAIELGTLIAEPIVAESHVAEGWVDAHEGGMLRWERVYTHAPADDPELNALSAAIVAALRPIDAALALQSDRGADQVQPFVHPHTGAYGVEAVVVLPDWDARPGDEVAALRARIVAAVGAALAAPPPPAQIRFSPTMSWEAGAGVTVLAWANGRPATAWPLDDDASAPGPDLEASLPALADQAHQIEVQVVCRPEDHDLVAGRVAEVAPTLAVPLAGGASRFVAWRGEPRFVPTWSAPLVSGLADALAIIEGIPGVEGVRAVPGEPFGFGDWAFADPGWWPCREGWFLRLRDGRRDRDACPHVQPRPPDDRDGEAIMRLIAACADLPEEVGMPEPVEDSEGRPGLRVHLPAECRDPHVLRRWISALGAARIPEGGHLWNLVFRPDAIVALRWWPHQAENPPIWGPGPVGSRPASAMIPDVADPFAG